MELSVVIPVYNEVESIEAMCRKLHSVLPGIGKSYEVILVDDGSKDGTWDKMAALSLEIPCLKLIRFRRVHFYFFMSSSRGRGHPCVFGTILRLCPCYR